MPALEATPRPLSSYGQRALRGERLTDILVIDHHGHFGMEPDGMTLEAEVADVIRELDFNGVSRAVAFYFGPDYQDGNDLILRAMEMHPDRVLGYATVVMSSPGDAMHELERCRRAGMVGLKLHSFYERERFAGDRYKPVWAFCEEHRWPVIIHGMDETLPRNYPKTVFITAHGIQGAATPSSIRMLQECPNYYWCTSATMCAMGAIERAVEAAGAHKLIFGSDFPGNNLATRLGSILAARISDDAVRAILGGNIARILSLTPRKEFPR